MDDAALLRYSRQILLPEIDIAGQERLAAARVLVAGLGGLGCPAAQYLAAAGVGELLLADHDVVELSNLQRQVLHTEERLGCPKAESAALAIAALNSRVSTRAITARLEAHTLPPLLDGVTLVLDCTDNQATRYLLNAACARAAVPLVSAAALGWEGRLAVFDPARGGPCYECLYPWREAAEEGACAVNGIAAPVVGAMGVLQALEALKLITGAGSVLRGELLVFDGLAADFHRLRLPRRAECPACALSAAAGPR